MATKKQEIVPKMQFLEHEKVWSCSKQAKVFMQRLWETISGKIQKVVFAKSSLEKVCLEEANRESIGKRIWQVRKMDKAATK